MRELAQLGRRPLGLVERLGHERGGRRPRARSARRASLSVMTVWTSRCCAPSCRSRTTRRRSSSVAATIRARDAARSVARLDVRDRRGDQLGELGQARLGVRGSGSVCLRGGRPSRPRGAPRRRSGVPTDERIPSAPDEGGDRPGTRPRSRRSARAGASRDTIRADASRPPGGQFACRAGWMRRRGAPGSPRPSPCRRARSGPCSRGLDAEEPSRPPRRPRAKTSPPAATRARPASPRAAARPARPRAGPAASRLAVFEIAVATSSVNSASRSSMWSGSGSPSVDAGRPSRPTRRRRRRSGRRRPSGSRSRATTSAIAPGPRRSPRSSRDGRSPGRGRRPWARRSASGCRPGTDADRSLHAPTHGRRPVGLVAPHRDQRHAQTPAPPLGRSPRTPPPTPPRRPPARRPAAAPPRAPRAPRRARAAPLGAQAVLDVGEGHDGAAAFGHLDRAPRRRTPGTSSRRAGRTSHVAGSLVTRAAASARRTVPTGADRLVAVAPALS